MMCGRMTSGSSYVAVTIIIKADTKEELEAIEETLVTIGKSYSCQIEAHYLKQRETLNTALPIGVRQVESMRTLMTQSFAVLMPFNVQELYLSGKGGTGARENESLSIEYQKEYLEEYATRNGFTNFLHRTDV